jgi:RNA polymerase sigma-32 factor
MNYAQDPVDALVTRARKAPKLSRERERELIGRWQQRKDRRAAEELAETSLRHVVFIALKYKRYGVPVDELIAEGNVGLMRALDKYDPDQGTRFSTYACYWIRSLVIAGVLRSRSLVSGGTGVFNTRTFFKLRRERAKARSLLGESEAADVMVASAMSVPQEKLRLMEQRVESFDLSLDAPQSAEGSATLMDGLAAETEQPGEFENRDYVHQVLGPLGEALGVLSDRERFIVENRVMADREEELSLSQLAQQFGVSRERVRQLEERAKEKLRTHVLKHYRQTRRVFEEFSLVA